MNAGWSQKTSFSQVDRHEIVKDKSVEELNAQLVSLVGENGAELLVGAIRSISVLGTEIAYQTWSYGSWPNVYEYKGKYFIE